ncbi:NAD-dependent epimerase/dehydratase family protein [Curvibacter sp. CHRR-16]|uniref:NAD-dependent epimerase/dehydratase family protein n=1 Tax=Curvibacter sp. CHRR-16 TaxID=2835872 RepID=UPI001BDA3A1F|nr:NAD-dependent epimerase/dehydratase family protein [Curvibacter sp. CHRR-16]MBT0571064.1 NAD-dependent epimerase/dehydratase family protein [Curvibacter sp. CHRR-16]
MNILVCGAEGFIGRHISAALRQQGHTVLRGMRRGGDIAMDYTHDVQATVWRDRLQGVDAVVNAVGILRNSRRTPMTAIHTDSPRALFEACAVAGVRRIVQVSALGVDGNPTLYASSKRAADESLLALNAAGQTDGVILRPSIVFGLGGASSELFLKLAQMAFLILPGAALRTKVQPVHVHDLAQVVSTLLSAPPGKQDTLACVGPRACTLAEFIAELRQQMTLAPARVWPLPDRLSRWSARMGDLIPLTPWGTETLTLLQQDNTAPAQAFHQLLGHAALSPEFFLTPSQELAT